MKKRVVIQKMEWDDPEVEKVSLRFDEATLLFHRIDTVNWEAYPYCPDVSFRIAHNGNAIFLNYRVNESDIKAVCSEDNGKVWEDSCVEFFVSFAEGSYYNIECNCIGKLLIGKGSGRGENRMRLTKSELKKVARLSSLGDSQVENRSGDWEISLIIPKEIFYPEIRTFNNVIARGNFYKCGDGLRTPHFLSWNPIRFEKPNFHLSEFFGELLFE